ncbi:uncharacterized protein EV422DRAFT_529358 [Fimicolochytrium jonesii]|uniref:uncharacterized protein n=1 Tax=Fimicolochytrium jonesii TaxID=1396493 RepID=UPI0022FDE1DA|nr:uncharacterized protein EV422DRAFT_529358 [Fimicolochytrium jonesii]KAI8821150.1 hypothetical protein EV422DRAFT_529358 [Fimicolochytrium jonesii]
MRQRWRQHQKSFQASSRIENGSLKDVFETSLSHLFRDGNPPRCNRLVVPKFQRPYCWTAPHVIQLLKDIKNAFTRSKKDSTYFLGALVLWRNEKDQQDCYSIVDGQQRITTLILILAVLRYLDKGNEDAHSKFVETDPDDDENCFRMCYDDPEGLDYDKKWAEVLRSKTETG